MISGKLKMKGTLITFWSTRISQTGKKGEKLIKVKYWEVLLTLTPFYTTKGHLRGGNKMH